MILFTIIIVIDNKGGHKIWLLAETYGYIAQFHPNQGAKKRNWFPPLLNWN